MTKRTGAALARGQSRQDYQTDPLFMEQVVRRFGKPRFDLAATKRNAQCLHYFTKRDNALVQPWPRKLCWLNPPYAHILPWAEKCASEAYRGVVTLFLVPAAVGSNWYCEHVFRHARTLLLNGRLTFVGETEPYPKDCILGVFDQRLPGFGSVLGPGTEVWRWNDPAWPESVPIVHWSCTPEFFRRALRARGGR